MEANSTPKHRENPSSRAGPSPVAVLAIIAGLILLIGVLLKPVTEIQQPQQQPVSQTELVRLRRAGQRTTLENMSRYFSEVASEFAAQVVRLPRLESSGVVWDDYGGIVAAARGGWLPSALDLVVPPDAVIPVVTRVGGPHLPVVFLQAPVNTPLPEPDHRSPETLAVGEWVLAVAREPNGEFVFTPGWYAGRVATRCGEITLQRVSTDQSYSAGMLGGGLFDMDGRLLALIVQCGDSYVAISIDDITTTLGAENSFTSQLLYRYGMRIEPFLDDAFRTIFQAEQALWVSEVWKDYPAHAAGLMPGDLILSLDGFPVTILQDLERLTRPGPDAVFDLQVRRGEEDLSILISVSESRAVVTDGDAAVAGIFLGETEPGYRVGLVEPQSPAALAGLRPGDRLLRMGDTVVDEPDVLRELLTDPDRPPLLAVADRGRKLVALLIRME